MIRSTIERWHQIFAAHDVAALDGLLAPDVSFHSPVVHTPQRGQALTRKYLAAAFEVLGKPSFRYVCEWFGTQDAVLEFVAEIDGIQINGVDMVRVDGQGRIVEFKVMLRPLKAIQLVHQKMAVALQGQA